MSTGRLRGRRAVPPPARPGAPKVDVMSVYGREQLAVFTEASSAMLRGIEAMRGLQQQAAQETAARYEDAARRLRESAAPADLMAIPFGLLQEDLQGVIHYWQELAGTALETQTEVMECAWQLLDSETALESVSIVENALNAIPGVRNLFPRKPRAELNSAQA
jgi:hypothetical protein